MAVIRHPLSGGRGLSEISLYKDYADRARENIETGHYFEAILVCSVGLDVLLNTLPDRLLSLSSSQLNDCQKRLLQELETQTLPAGGIIKRLETACVLHRRLLRALKELIAGRNRILHPFQGRKWKSGAMSPSSATKDAADQFYRKFCHVIDLGGGQSPHSEEKQLNRYIPGRKRTFRKHFSKP